MPYSPWHLAGRIATLRTPRLTATIDLDHPSAGLQLEKLCGQSLAGASLFGVQIDPAGSVSPEDCFLRGNDLIAAYAETPSRPFRTQIYWRVLDDERSSGSPSDTLRSGDRIGNPIPVIPLDRLELVLSIQTDLLDIEAAVSVCTTLQHVESWQLLDAADDRLARSAFELRGEERLKATCASAAAKTDSAPAAKVGGCTTAPLTQTSENPDCCLIRLSGGLPSYIEMVHPADFRQTTFEWTSATPPIIRLAHRLFAERLEKGVIRRSRIRGLFAVAGQGDDFARNEHRRFAASEPPLTA